MAYVVARDISRRLVTYLVKSLVTSRDISRRRRDGHRQSAAVCMTYLVGMPFTCSVLQCVAVCYSVLQCVAVCCSVLQVVTYVVGMPMHMHLEGHQTRIEVLMMDSRDSNGASCTLDTYICPRTLDTYMYSTNTYIDSTQSFRRRLRHSVTVI